MKKKLFLFLLLPFSLVAQFTVSPNPFNMNSGTITITYGPDYSLFDPQFNQNLYLYTGLETDGNAVTWDYHDDWTNLATSIPLTYNAGLGYYVATLNIATRNYLKEPALTYGPIDMGTYVNNWYFIIHRVGPNAQSADLIGTNYGFQPLALSTNELIIKPNDVYFYDGKLISTLNKKIAVSIFDVLGKKVKEITIQNESVDLNLTNKGIYLAVIETENAKKTIKFVN